MTSPGFTLARLFSIWLVHESVALINPDINPSYSSVATDLSCGSDVSDDLMLTALTSTWIHAY